MEDDDPSRIERLMNQIATLRGQVAEVQSLRQAERVIRPNVNDGPPKL